MLFLFYLVYLSGYKINKRT